MSARGVLRAGTWLCATSIDHLCEHDMTIDRGCVCSLRETYQSTPDRAVLSSISAP